MNILIIENDENKKSELKTLFQNACHGCSECKIEAVGFGYHGLTLAAEYNPTVIIINSFLPDINGIAVLEQIRKNPDKYGLPYVVLITSENKTAVASIGYVSGANDVLEYPFTFSDLINKMKNLGKCLLIKKTDRLSDKKIYTFNELEINDDSKHVYYKGQRINLERKEYDLLIYLIKNKSKAIKREEIMDAVWGSCYIGITDRVVDSCICKLKSKIPMLSEYIEGIFKFGYRLSSTKTMPAFKKHCDKTVRA